MAGCWPADWHATVAADEMLAVPAFDNICQGPGEQVIVDLVRDQRVPAAFPGHQRAVDGRMAHDRPQPLAQAGQRQGGTALGLAAGAGMRLGPAAGGHYPHQPCVPVAV